MRAWIITGTARSMINGAIRFRRTPPSDPLEEGRGLRPYRDTMVIIQCEIVSTKNVAEDGTLNAERMATYETLSLKIVAEYGMLNANHMAALLLSMCALLCFLVRAKNH